MRMMRSRPGCSTERIRALFKCFRSSMQKFGAVSGEGRLSGIRHASGRDALAER